MKCSVCNHENIPEAKFCQSCGHTLTGTSSPVSQPPQVVIVREKEKKRRVPGFIWPLIGAAAAFLGIYLLLGLNMVEVPPVPTSSNLPQPIKAVWQSIDEWQEEERFVRFLVDLNLPIPGIGDVGNISQKGLDYLAACSEDITYVTTEINYMAINSVLTFTSEFEQPLNADKYDATFVHKKGGYYSNGECVVFYGEFSEIYCRIEDYSWDSSLLQVTIFPKGAGCELAKYSISIPAPEDAASCYPDETFHANWGCCTNGCFCFKNGQWGCWETCNDHCKFP